MKLAGDYLGEKSPFCLSMGTWTSHIERFEQQYDKAFARDPLFGANLMDHIQKRVRVFLQYCNNTSIEDVKLGALVEFGGLQKKLGRGEWLTSTLVWMDRTAQKEEGCWKSDGHGTGERPRDGGDVRDIVFNHGVDLKMWIMEILGDMTAAARSDNLHIPLAADVREI